MSRTFRPAWGVLFMGLAGTVILALVLPLWLRPAGPPRPGDNDSPSAPVYPTSSARASESDGRPAPVDSDLDAPGIVRPPVVAAADASLDDGEPVIGVIAGNKHRAYRLRALAVDRGSHIVNDVLGDVPISVTHCDLRRCTRLFTADTHGEPLPLSQGGLRDGKMLLKWDGRRYDQETAAPLVASSPPLPYVSIPAEETTWGQWRQAHPDTDVYVDPPPLPPEGPHVLAAADSSWLVLLVALSAAPLTLAVAGVLVSILLGRLVRRQNQSAAK